MRGKGHVGALAGEKSVVTGGGNHGGIIGGEREGREEDLESLAPLGETLTQTGSCTLRPPETKMLSTRESSAAASVRSTKSCTTAC